MKHANIIGIALLLAKVLYADLITVDDTNISIEDWGYSWNILIDQHPTNGDYTGFALQLNGSQIYSLGSFLDQGCSVFLDGTTYLTSGQTFDIGYGDFYVTVSTAPAQYGDEVVTASGWAILNNSAATGLSMVQNQITYNVVPEPASVFLFALGSFSVWLLRRNKTQGEKELES